MWFSRFWKPARFRHTRLSSISSLAWLAACSPGQATTFPIRKLYCAADALAWLPGQAGICRRYAEEAVEAYQDVSAPDWSFSFQAGSRTDLAIARLGNGEVGGAAEALAPVFELPPGQRTNPVIQSVHRVHAALNRAPPSVNGRTLKAEIENFTDLGEEIFLATRAN